MEKEQGSDSESDSRSQRLEARTRRIDKQQDVKQMQQVQNNMREERAREREMRLLQRIYPEADFLSSGTCLYFLKQTLICYYYHHQRPFGPVLARRAPEEQRR